MQAAINPALAAAMTLEQAAQMGEFSPVTKDGRATVVGGKLQQALQPMMPQGTQQGMPGMQPSMPAVQNVAQQAGLGGQIQAMQMQNAQKAMMQQAMQQSMPPAGIERLNPQMGNFAEGGIVGYNGEDGSVAIDPGSEGGSSYREQIKKVAALLGLPLAAAADLVALPYSQYKSIREPGAGYTPVSDVLRRIVGTPESKQASISEEADREAARFAQDVPYGTEGPAKREQIVQAPPEQRKQPSAPTGGGDANLMRGIAATLGERARAEAASMQGPATPEQILEREKRNRAAFDQFLISQGIKPDAFKQREEEDRLLMQQQRDLLRERMQREEGKDTFLSRAGAALRGFSQMKGQGVGGALIGAHENLARQLQAGEIRMDQFRDMEMRLNELEITRRRALDDAKRATAEGRWKDAQQSLDTERAAANEIKKIQISTYMPQAQAQIEEAKVGEMAKQRGQIAQGQEFARLQGIAATYEARKAESLRKLDEDFAKQNDILLKSEKAMGRDKMPAAMRQSLEAAEAAHSVNRAAIARQFDERLAMINQRLYPGVDFSAGRAAAPSANPAVEAARKIVSGSK